MSFTHFPKSLENNFYSQARDKGRYKNSEGIHDTNHSIEAARIFLETQFKRFMHALFPRVKRFKYFSRNETEKDIYQFDPIKARIKNGCEIHNLNHASQLIQIGGVNVVTDPTFGHLNRILYPQMTKPGFEDLSKLPKIDVILISHTHRDHVDEKSLKYFLKDQPQLLVPAGSGKLFTDLGFEKVQECAWYDAHSIEVNLADKIQFRCVPADHWSGRGLFDKNKSSVNGWIISPTHQDEIIYFAGDTAKLSQEKMRALAWMIMQCDKTQPNAQKKIYNMQPAGPNYTRRDMQSTHQSVLESLLTSLELANHITSLEKEVEQDVSKRKSASQWLDCVATILMHHNKYQLGPDRFNEALFIFDKTLRLLQHHSNEYIQNALKKEKQKNFIQNLFHRNKAFIYEGVLKLRAEAKKIWPGNAEIANQNLINFLRTRTHAPKIGQATDENNCFPKIDEYSRSNCRPLVNRNNSR